MDLRCVLISETYVLQQDNQQLAAPINRATDACLLKKHRAIITYAMLLAASPQ